MIQHFLDTLWLAAHFCLYPRSSAVNNLSWVKIPHLLQCNKTKAILERAHDTVYSYCVLSRIDTWKSSKQIWQSSVLVQGLPIANVFSTIRKYLSTFTCQSWLLCLSFFSICNKFLVPSLKVAEILPCVPARCSMTISCRQSDQWCVKD